MHPIYVECIIYNTSVYANKFRFDWSTLGWNLKNRVHSRFLKWWMPVRAHASYTVTCTCAGVFCACHVCSALSRHGTPILPGRWPSCLVWQPRYQKNPAELEIHWGWQTTRNDWRTFIAWGQSRSAVLYLLPRGGHRSRNFDWSWFTFELEASVYWHAFRVLEFWRGHVSSSLF